MTTQAIDRAETISTYTNTARFNSRHVVLLAQQLTRVAPSDLTADQRAALSIVGQRASDVADVRRERARCAPPALKQPRFQMSVAWTSLHQALSAVGSILPELGSEGPEAAAIVARLFVEGTAFTQLDAPALWGESKGLLERIDREGMAARIDALVHPKHLVHVRQSFARLSEAVGAEGAVVAMPPRRALAEAVARFAYAVASYARTLSVGIEDTDEAGLSRFVNALAPIDELRITGKAGEEEDDDDAGPPEVVTPGSPTGPFVNA